MYAKLYKLSTNKNALRTPYMEGVVDQQPAIGQSLMMVCKPFTAGTAGRVVFTSTIQEIRPMIDGAVEFDTLNSTYLYQPVTGKETVQ
jgi:hypothetical protein